MNIEEIKKIAEKELEEEDLRIAIDKFKVKLRRPKWYHRLFPYRIVIIKKEHL